MQLALFRRITLRQIVWAGCLVTLLYALFSRGVYHFDEHYQILEYAHMKLFGTPVEEHLAWEYPLQMRSGVQPFMAWCVGRVLVAMGCWSPWLAVSVPLALRKIVWSPYPAWVVRYFNFNDWTRFAVRSKNIYEVLPEAAGRGEP